MQRPLHRPAHMGLIGQARVQDSHFPAGGGEGLGGQDMVQQHGLPVMQHGIAGLRWRKPFQRGEGAVGVLTIHLLLTQHTSVQRHQNGPQ